MSRIGDLLKKLALAVQGRGRAVHTSAVLLGALLLAWPGLLNGFPLLYPDSMTYLGDGPAVARAVFLHQFSEYYGVRSFLYSLGILPFHWNITAWPVAALQCLLVAWVLWLLTRVFVRRQRVLRYLALMVFLSLLSSVSWYACFIMPDILGPLVYLGFFLLVFARQTLARAERWGLCLLACWGITSHASHMVLAGGLWLLLAIMVAVARRRQIAVLLRHALSFAVRLVLRRPHGEQTPAADAVPPQCGWQLSARGLLQAAAIVALAAAAQMALHGYLYGKPSLNGERPPYLMARIIADGPGRWYLEGHCDQQQWAVCDRFRQLSDNPDDLLWGAESAYDAGSEEDRDRAVSEEMPFVLATLRTYPRQELAKAAANFRDQLLAFGPYGFDPSPWILGQFSEVLPSSRSSYVRSRQANQTLPLDEIADVQMWVIVASLVVIATRLVLLWWRRSPGIAGLSLVVAAVVLANAAVTGVLSVVDDRYGCRVVWLVPLLASICVLEWLNPRPAAEPRPQAQAPLG